MKVMLAGGDSIPANGTMRELDGAIELARSLGDVKTERLALIQQVQGLSS